MATLQKFLLIMMVAGGSMLLVAAATASQSRGISVALRTSEKAGAPSAGRVQLYNQSHALVIGIDNYTGGWPRLSNAVKDAELVAQELKTKGFNVTLEKDLNSVNLKRVFEEFFIVKGEDPQARLFVWFAGEHRVMVEKQGYDTYQKRVRLKKGRSVSLYADLSRAAPLKIGLYVDTRPDDARVRILNIGPAFYQGMALDAGRNQVEVSADGHATKTLWVALDAGEDKSLDIRLEPAAAGRTGDTWQDPVTGMEFVWVPQGCFEMGSPPGEAGRDDDDDEGPVHRVCVDGFWLGKYEVTNAQFRKYKSGHSSKDYKGHSFNGDNQPAVYVSWEDAVAFARWLTQRSGGRYQFRLPTEAEWEYAARAGTQTARFWGDDPDDACRYANVADRTAKKNWSNWTIHNCDDGYAVTSPVGSFQPNAFGLHDILGNVWEWNRDWYGKKYSSGSVNNPTGPSGGSRRVYRGGSWGSVPRYVRNANRLRYTPGIRSDNLGFRLLRSP